METKQFKTESKKLLDLMTNSIYTNREIFLRELISNASDAIDKYHYLSLHDDLVPPVDAYQIYLNLDKNERIIEVTDNGIGMTHDELVSNLGTIASSGSAKFIESIKEKEKEKEKDPDSQIDIIGQFGVGFYSAFMVGKKVVVETKSPYDSKGYRFTSDGEESYTIEEIEKEESGSKVIVYLRDNKDEDSYDEFLDPFTIEDLVKKYSDYIRYPIKMMVENEEPELDKDGKAIEGKYKKVSEEKTLNSMLPLWKHNKNEVTEEQMKSFYKDKFMDYQDPMHSCFFNVEGMISYSAMLFIPSKAPYDLYSEKYEKGLQLYTKGVMIMEKCKDLIPDYLKFVKGVVDSSDLSLNISRELLQKNNQLQKIATSVEKKIISDLENLKKNDFEVYKTFFKEYGVHLKYGIYEMYGSRKEMLQDLLIYQTINSDEMISLDEYVSKMKPDQKSIYFASGKDSKSVLSMPQMDGIKKKEYDCLILPDDIDEFVLMMIDTYKDKKFKNISNESFDEVSEEEKKAVELQTSVNKTLLEKIKDCLAADVDEVRLSTRLVSSPVCLVSKDGVSFEMEKVLKKNNNNEDVKATRILEINPNHPLFEAIQKIDKEHPDDLGTYAKVLYSEALLIEGLPIKDMNEFTQAMCDLMVKAAK